MLEKPRNPTQPVNFKCEEEPMTIHQKSKSHLLTELILAKGQYLETEQMFRDNNETWPVMIPEEEINQSFPRIIIVRHLVVTWGLSISSVQMGKTLTQILKMIQNIKFRKRFQNQLKKIRKVAHLENIDAISRDYTT
ncbi:hypothetical protein IFM89_032421 [Coptis chinensis]|uniref:Uncharacterized protein n=1 Tax=Coptis chinensis TaxID=261450 RepID=A0A835I671_9MAGN|nr:hypothetical protein IFM89_032421 [Coptis chinensis]